MAFTNTGFMPTADSLTPYAGDPWFLIAIMIAVVLGAIGFPVIYAVSRNLRSRRHWPLHTKLTLVAFGALFVGGGLAYLVTEWTNPATLGDLDPGQRILQASFMSVMARSGGFATVDYGQLDGAGLLVTDMLMFVGGGSASTAGGIKVTTLAILFLAAVAEARGADEMEAYRRRIPQDVLRLAVSVVLWGATLVAGSTILLDQRLRHLRAHHRLHRRRERSRPVRARRDDVRRPHRHRDPRRRARPEPAAPAVQTTGREAHRWLIASPTTPPSS